MRKVSTLLVIVLMNGCACGPGPRAKRAVDDARAAGAETYAPGDLGRALSALDKAARSEGAERDRLHESARLSARRAIERSTVLRKRVTTVRSQLEGELDARAAESRAAAEVVLATARAGLADDLPLPDGVQTMTATRAAELTSEAGAIVLDIRPASQRRERAAGAADAPPGVLEHTRWPQGAQLVLLGSGVGNQDVVTAAGTLLRRGYDNVSVVPGGLPAWKAAGLLVHGRPRASDVSVIEVKELAASAADVVIVDVRDERSYAAGHIPGAVNIAADDLAAAAVRQLAGRRVVVYAANEDAGRLAAEGLANAGHRDLRRLLGGLVAWARAKQRLDAAPLAPRGTAKLARLDDDGALESSKAPNESPSHGEVRP